MSGNETSRLGLPLLMPAQAQKHVTVNEALMRLDGLTDLLIEQLGARVPPDTVADGQAWDIGANATGAWAGKTGQIAIGCNGGWIFAEPRRGMQGFVAARGVHAIHNGKAWVPGAQTLGASGAGMIAGMDEAEVIVSPGASVVSGVTIPAGAMVIGATARVVEPITGTLTAWRLGTDGAEDRFGSGLGLGTGSWARGMLGTPMTYYSAKPLRMTAEGGVFAGGRVRVAVHWWELRLPDA